MQDEFINNLKIPPALVRAIVTGEWGKPIQGELLRLFFPDKRLLLLEFCNIESMRRENKDLTDPKSRWYWGAKDDVSPPGDIDPRLALIIATTIEEEYLALDYRSSLDKPRVLFFSGSPPRWVEIAPNIEVLLQKLSCKNE